MVAHSWGLSAQNVRIASLLSVFLYCLRGIRSAIPTLPRLANINLQSLEGNRRDDEEKRNRKDDERKLKRLKDENLPASPPRRPRCFEGVLQGLSVCTGFCDLCYSVGCFLGC